MKFAALAFLVVGSYALAGQPGQSRPANDLQNMQGTWRVESTQGVGQEPWKQEMQQLTLTIQGEKMLAEFADKKAEANFRLFPEKEQPEIEVTLIKGPEDAKDAIGKTFHGIYQLQNKTLKIAYGGPGDKRPASFRSEGEPGVYVVVLTRARQ